AGMSPRKYRWLKNKGYKKLDFWDIPSSNYVYININHKKIPFNDKRVRKALSLLIPRRDILKYKLHNTATLATGLFSPAFNYFYYPKLPIDEYRPYEARKLLEDAGFVLNEAGKFTRNGKLLTIDWKVSSNRASLEMVETIKSYYEKAGLTVDITVLEWGSFMKGFKKGRYDLVLAQWVGFTGPEMLKNVFHSGSFPPKGANRGKYKNKFVDAKIDIATNEIDRKMRNRLYKEAYLAAIDDYAYINLWHPNTIWVGKKCIKDIKLYSNGSFNALLNLKNQCKEDL
ncbi:MAG: ABC transporter substrate-binding protein, partial [Halobacteriovoraceae bacterium]|nr:ABC transporter substrate-binding protein [Halobacteriovoraceae bacterium]